MDSRLPACPTSLHDLEQQDAVIDIPPEDQTPYACKSCKRPNFVIVAGVVICAACGSGAGMSVVASNVVQELRTERQQHIDAMIKMIEVILPFAEDFGNRMPLARPQMQKLIAFCKERLLELKL